MAFDGINQIDARTEFYEVFFKTLKLIFCLLKKRSVIQSTIFAGFNRYAHN